MDDAPKARKTAAWDVASDGKALAEPGSDKEVSMVSRCLALFFLPALPFMPLMAPMGPVPTANAIIAGIVGTLLAPFVLVNERARVGLALVGVWMLLSAFVISSTILESMVSLAWGLPTYLLMIGPFSERPRTMVVPVPAPVRKDEPAVNRDDHLPLAA